MRRDNKPKHDISNATADCLVEAFCFHAWKNHKTCQDMGIRNVVKHLNDLLYHANHDTQMRLIQFKIPSLNQLRLNVIENAITLRFTLPGIIFQTNRFIISNTKMPASAVTLISDEIRKNHQSLSITDVIQIGDFFPPLPITSVSRGTVNTILSMHVEALPWSDISSRLIQALDPDP